MKVGSIQFSRFEDVSTVQIKSGSDVLLFVFFRHEDGTVRFWDASGVALRPLYKLSTANIFQTDCDHNDSLTQAGEEEWPPFQKVRPFDHPHVRLIFIHWSRHFFFTTLINSNVLYSLFNLMIFYIYIFFRLLTAVWCFSTMSLCCLFWFSISIFFPFLCLVEKLWTAVWHAAFVMHSAMLFSLFSSL